MKAAVIRGPSDIRVETVDTPSIRENEILVKVAACGICGSDLHMYKAGPTSIPQGRNIIGHEISGEVVEVGSAVKGVKVGSRVVGMGFYSCGECKACREGNVGECPSRGVPGYGLDGGFAEYVVVPNPIPGIMLFEMPERMGWEEAAAIEPMNVSCWAVEQAQIQPDQTVVILGAGVIGLGALQFTKLQGAAKVIVSEPSAKRLAMAKHLGADVVINPREADPVEVVKEVTSGKKADVVIECSGVPAAFYQGLNMLRRSGTMVQVAIYEQDLHLSPELMSQITTGNLTIRGSGGSMWDKTFDLVSSGKIKTKDLVTHEFKLDDVKQAFETQINANESIKVVVKP